VHVLRPPHDRADCASEARRLFEHRVPELLARNPGATRAVGGRCRFELSDAGCSWVVDFTADPPRVAADASGSADCGMRLRSAELVEMIGDPAAGQVLAWQGRLRMRGDRALLRRVGDVLFPSADGDNSDYAGYYTSLSRLVPDPRLTFMNHGYAAADDDFGWLDDDDDERRWRYAINLVRRTLAGTSVRGARVLDVGCGRGGAASYIARRLGARAVTGLDACADAIAFCERRHPGVSFVHGYAGALPFADGAFDVVLNVESSHCYPDRAAFLREVARVLRPGGRFCFADIVQGGELADLRELLGRVPALRVLDEQDITANVARAIERNREHLSRLLLDATDPHLCNGAIVADLIRSINVQIHDNYASGRWGYRVWLVEKAST
jgi:SAM-dependent methyltransferase